MCWDMVLGFRVRFRLVVWMKAAVFCRKNAVRVKHIVGAYIIIQQPHILIHL